MKIPGPFRQVTEMLCILEKLNGCRMFAHDVYGTKRHGSISKSYWVVLFDRRPSTPNLVLSGYFPGHLLEVPRASLNCYLVSRKGSVRAENFVQPQYEF